jgi:hypothetical protein
MLAVEPTRASGSNIHIVVPSLNYITLVSDVESAGASSGIVDVVVSSFSYLKLAALSSN